MNPFGNKDRNNEGASNDLSTDYNQSLPNTVDNYFNSNPSVNNINQQEDTNFNQPANYIANENIQGQPIVYNKNYSEFNSEQLQTLKPTPNKPLPLKITYDRSLGARGRAIVLICIFAIVLSFAFGFFNQKNSIQDQNKRNDIFYVIRGLNSYYKDSSEFIEDRHYPISKCSAQLNSFDYEYTLRNALTGNSLSSPSHSYIKIADFPFDQLGKYTGAFSDYAGMDAKNAGKTVEDLGLINCFNALPAFEKENYKNKYFDGYKICKHDNKIEPIKGDFFSQKNCYLYSTTKNGDTYRIAYYSNSLKKYVIYSQYRNNALSIVYSD